MGDGACVKVRVNIKFMNLRLMNLMFSIATFSNCIEGSRSGSSIVLAK